MSTNPNQLEGDVEVIGSVTGLEGTGDYSVTRLVEFFDVIAKGSWGGPAADSPLSVPASFRDRLAAAAV